MKRLLPLVVVLGLIACGSDGGGSPTQPSPNPNPAPTVTRVIALEGDMNFGDVLVGSTAEKVVRILNRGTGSLSISGITGPGAGSVMTASWTQGTIQPNQWQDVTFRFTPAAVQTYNGTLTINGDQTSGTNTMQVTARGQRERWSQTGVGDSVFDMPLDVARVRIIGVYNGSSSNFVVRIGGRLIVNEVIGTFRNNPRYEGTLLTGGGGVVSITFSSGVQWSFEELR